MHAQGQLINTPFSGILTQVCISEKKLAKSTSCQINLSDGEDQKRMFHQF